MYAASWRLICTADETNLISGKQYVLLQTEDEVVVRVCSLLICHEHWRLLMQYGLFVRATLLGLSTMLGAEMLSSELGQGGCRDNHVLGDLLTRRFHRL